MNIDLTRTSPTDMAEYLEMVALGTRCPKGVLNVMSAVRKCFFSALGFSPVDDDVHRLITGLIKSGTQAPMEKSKVLPRQPFLELFMLWDENNKLSNWALQLKCLVLLAL